MQHLEIFFLYLFHSVFNLLINVIPEFCFCFSSGSVKEKKYLIHS